MLKKVVSLYAVYVVYFLGVGLTSSGIVLMPFNPVRYSIILILGLLLFSLGSFVNEFVIDKKEVSFIKVVRLITVSLTLAIGIGMISGGISHFKESPIYVSYLIPLGSVISIISFVIKNSFQLNKKEIKTLAIYIVVIGFILHGGLSLGANYYLGDTGGAMGGDIFMDTH